MAKDKNGDEPRVPGVVPFRRTPDLLATKRIFDVTATGFRMAYPDVGIVFEAAYLSRHHDDLSCQLTVYCTIAGARVVDSAGTLSIASYNLTSPQTRNTRAKFLAERSGATELDWAGALEDFSTRVIRAEQAGTPAAPLSTLQRPGVDDVWMVGELPLFARLPVIWFGDGGAAKSYLALWAAALLAKAGRKVLYCDWEFAAEDHRERLGRLCGEDNLPPGIFYARCVQPLVRDVDRLRTMVLKHGITYVILDSVAYACQGAPESAEAAQDYARATRSLGVGSLHIAHITKNSGEPEDKTPPTSRKPFGSVFWANSARSTWFLKRADEEEDSDVVNVAAYNCKSNTGRRLPARGLRLTFSTDRTLVESFDVALHGELARKLPIWERMRNVLAACESTHGLSLEELAEALDAKPESVARTASRLKGVFSRDGGNVTLKFGAPRERF